MAASILVDTGPILALIDRSDRWHHRCEAILPRLPLPLLTSEAVLTEVFYMLRTDVRGIEVAWKFVQSGALTLGPITEPDFPWLHSLMKQYADLPMDFADATPVYLAQRHALDTVFTVDSDFLVYRIRGRRPFRVVPDLTR